MKEFPTIERSIWRSPPPVQFESIIAATELSQTRTLALIDAPTYFNLVRVPMPVKEADVLDALAANQLLVRTGSDQWSVTNLGAILLAHRLAKFPNLQSKAIRIVQYQGNGRIKQILQQSADKGYANGFEDLFDTVIRMLPIIEEGKCTRDATMPAWPETALRELILNAMIHQDFSTKGTGTLIEIFSDRVEISNPGPPLVDVQRLVNTPPISRNHGLTAMMQKMNLINLTGSGWDKIVTETEQYKMPVPLAEVESNVTRVVLFSPRDLSDMDRETRIWSIYQHACLQLANRDYLTNASLRNRFGIELKNSAIASRLIKEAVEANVIIPCEANIGRKHMRYAPAWADLTSDIFI